MKIYSNNTLSIDEQLNILKKCKEQRLWVRCDDLTAQAFNWGPGIMYVCPMEDPGFTGYTGKDPVVYCKYVRADNTDLPVNNFAYEIGRYFWGNTIAVADPVTTFTEEELFGLNADTHRKPFKKIEGKDVWILATGPVIGWVYVSVIDASRPDILTANTIPEEYVYPNSDSYLEYNPYSMIEESDIPWSEIQAYMPLEILTQDEMDEALEKAEEVYENPPEY